MASILWFFTWPSAQVTVAVSVWRGSRILIQCCGPLAKRALGGASVSHVLYTPLGPSAWPESAKATVSAGFSMAASDRPGRVHAQIPYLSGLDQSGTKLFPAQTSVRYSQL